MNISFILQFKFFIRLFVSYSFYSMIGILKFFNTFYLLLFNACFFIVFVFYSFLTNIQVLEFFLFKEIGGLPW